MAPLAGGIEAGGTKFVCAVGTGPNDLRATARFDTTTKTFKEWDLPPGAQPHGLLVDRNGIVWYTGHGNGTIGRLKAARRA